MSQSVSAVIDPAPSLMPTRRPWGITNPLARFLIVRFLLIFPTVFILVTMVFVLMRSIGDPITAALGGRLTAAQLAERISSAGYDRPILVQYFEYLGQIFTGNFGTAITDGRPVSELLVTYGSATLELASYAILVALIVGIPPVSYTHLTLPTKRI